LTYRFFHPIEIRYADIDAQRHVNSARYFSYMEQARAAYIQRLGLWAGDDFDQIGIILLEQCCTYHRAARYGDEIQVGVRAVRIGNKSMNMEYSLQAPDGGEYANGQTVLVAYDYLQERSIPVPENWRRAITEFEGLS
jgi:acyl-CoA thioester hydrolase